MIDLAIIVLNYNTFNETQRLVNALLLEKCPANAIYVLDNNSSDKVRLKTLNVQIGVNLILSAKNGGYAYGNNLAIRKAISDGKKNFLILNPDIEISFITIKKMYDRLNTLSNVGILGCRLCYRTAKNIVFSDGGLLFPEKGYMGGHFNANHNTENDEECGLIYDVDYVDGSALMFKKQVLDEIGFLNEAFFMYYEESEWCLRLLKNTSFKIAVDTCCTAYNLYSEKGAFYEYYMTRNRIWLCRLFHGNKKYVIKERLKLTRKAIKKGSFRLANAYIRGIINGCYAKIT
jgi:GT2 family glycosyltransferase